MMDWKLYYGLIALGVAIGVTVMAIVSICREPDEPKPLDNLPGKVCSGFSEKALSNLAHIGGLESLREYAQRVQAQRDELQAVLDWMKKNHDLVYHFIGATGVGFLDRVRDAMREDNAVAASRFDNDQVNGEEW